MAKILSLFDYTGNWPRPYAKAGYEIYQVDLKLGGDIHDFEAITEWTGPDVHGILAAIPCTDFASSGARHWQRKDNDGTTEASIELVLATLDLIRYYKARKLRFYAIENPVGRIHKLVPQLGKPKLIFDPCDYGDPYEKRTCLWGEFNADLKRNPVVPVRINGFNPLMALAGGKSEKTKEFRSATPAGFARAFFEANP